MTRQREQAAGVLANNTAVEGVEMILFRYSIGERTAPGIPELDLRLKVGTRENDEQGSGTIKIAGATSENEVLTSIHGSFDTFGDRIVAYMSGESPKALDHEVNFRGALVVKDWGGPGVASYWYMDGAGNAHHVGPVPAIPLKH
jgi:hypothetical protein